MKDYINLVTLSNLQYNNYGEIDLSEEEWECHAI